MQMERGPGIRIGLALCGATMLMATPTAGASTAPARQDSSPSGTVWLCRPGVADDPCETSTASTAVTADGSTQVTPATSTTASPFDCFYAYPTVSMQRKDNANLGVQAAEIGAAVSQASR